MYINSNISFNYYSQSGILQGYLYNSSISVNNSTITANVTIITGVEGVAVVVGLSYDVSSITISSLSSYINII